MRRAPATRRKAEEEIEALQDKHDQLMQLKPIKEMVENMKETEIPGLNIKLKKATDEVTSGDNSFILWLFIFAYIYHNFVRSGTPLGVEYLLW